MRLTATAAEAIELAKQLVAAVDELKAADNRPAGPMTDRGPVPDTPQPVDEDLAET
jgi:hypothetical protein